MNDIKPTADELADNGELKRTSEESSTLESLRKEWGIYRAANAVVVNSNLWPLAKTAMNLNELSQIVHAANIKWWQDIQTGQPIKRNKGELLALIHSEISEALEGERKDLMDDKLPHRKMAEVELVDAIIRILDYAAGFGYDLQGAFDEKMAFNAQREDHKHEARRIAGGKQF